MIYRIGVIALSLAVIQQTLVLWDATGRHMWTTYRDEAEAPVNNLAAPFGDTGETFGTIEDKESKFQLGFAPTAEPWLVFNPQLVSVMTLALPAAAIALMQALGLALDVRRNKKAGGARSGARKQENET